MNKVKTCSFLVFITSSMSLAGTIFCDYKHDSKHSATVPNKIPPPPTSIVLSEIVLLLLTVVYMKVLVQNYIL